MSDTQQSDIEGAQTSSEGRGQLSSRQVFQPEDTFSKRRETHFVGEEGGGDGELLVSEGFMGRSEKKF